MITVTGRTFEHRDLLRSMRGKFDQDNKRWTFSDLNASDLATVRALVGCMVQIVSDPAPSYSDDISDILAKLFKTERRERIGKSAIYGDDSTYHNYFADRNPAAFFGFSSLGKFTDYIEAIRPHCANDDRRAGWRERSGGFEGTRTMTEALNLARHGWQEGTERALAAMEALAVANARVRRRRHSMVGGAVNVGRMLSGDPAHMIQRPKQPGSKVVTLFVEAGCNANIKADSIIARAALIGAITDLIENNGYVCTIVTVDTSVEDGEAIYQLAVNLKEAGERLNLSDLMFALGHPSFLRRFSFAACSSVEETREIWRGQGHASNAFDKKHTCRPNEFYIPVLDVNATSDDPLELLSHVIPDGLPVTIERV